MKSITLHNLDDDLVDFIEKESKDAGLSLNKTIKKLLHKTLGINPKSKLLRKEEFLYLSGIWGDEEFDEFNKDTKEFDRVNSEDCE